MIRRFLFTLVSTAVLAVGPCLLDSWNVAVNPGFGSRDPFIGVRLDFGEIDFVVPVFFPGD